MGQRREAKAKAVECSRKVAECSREARGAQPLVRPGSRDPSVDTLEAPVAPLSQLSWRERSPGSAASAARGHPGEWRWGCHRPSAGQRGQAAPLGGRPLGDHQELGSLRKHQLMAGRLVGQIQAFL